jgi:hypothetical protein
MRTLGLVAFCLILGGAWLLIGRYAHHRPASAPVSGDLTPVVVFRVVDAAGRGIAGARVADQRTGPSGTCDVRIPVGERVPIPVSREGYCPAEVLSDALPAGARAERWVRLERGRTIVAKVQIEGSEEPAAGANVEIDLWPGPVDAKSPRVATTDAGGLVRFEGVPDGHFGLSVVPRRYVSPWPYRLQLVQGRSHDPIVLHALPTTHVVVEIVDRDGNLVRSARVLTRQDHASVPRVTIAENGIFETDIAKGAPCEIDVLAASWASGSLTFRADGCAERRERIVLTPAREHPDAHRLRVRVVDRETGDPIPGAHVRIEFKSPTLDGGRTSTDALDLPGMGTDADGWLVIGAIPLPSVYVYASHPGFLAGGGIPLSGTLGLLEGNIDMPRTKPSRTITCRAERPVEIDWTWQDTREDGAIELGGFGDEESALDIRYRPESDIARMCVLEDVAIGSHDVMLPLYPTGDLLVRCTDPEGYAVPRACIAVEGDGFKGSAWKEDPRAELLVRDVPAGDCNVWVLALGRTEAGPLSCTILPGRTTMIDVRLGRPLALLAVHLELVDGRALEACEVVMLDPVRGSQVQIVAERFWEMGVAPAFVTGSDGRCYVPAMRHDVVVGFRDLAASRAVVVPQHGIYDVDVRLDWRVCVSAIGDESSGFRRGDVVLSWGGRAVRDPEDCIPTDDPTLVVVRRGHETVEFTSPTGDPGLTLDRVYFEVE